jgi:low temperature requirement protein LtrA
MWWVYFDWPMHELLTSPTKTYIWGYGHFLIFGAAAAVGAGLAVAIDHTLHHAEIGAVGAGMAVAVPVAIYLLVLWLLHVGIQDEHSGQRFLLPVVVVLILLTPFSNGPSPLLIGLLLVAMLAVKLVGRYRRVV